MQANRKNIAQSGYGNLGNTYKPLPLLVIDFIETNISTFIKYYIDGEKEKGLNSNFALCMNNQINNELFTFQHEDLENTSSGNSPSIDIGVYTRVKGRRGKRFFALEAKRLSTKLDPRRKKEYVLGDAGGIERFKRNIHACELNTAAMIGYVQTDCFDSWENKINQWIDEKINSSNSCDLTWINDDKLIKRNNTLEIAKYSSNHICLSNKQLELIHLWINLVDINNSY
ncbi:hypothetical protein CRU86_00585 [Aliarcobacter skirrowii]|uniref:hypothetical protein n=1 Tax=Aliarcobacter skirrowii TaxID=28200 RepID=UPI00100A9160|nr:hypothetical protein [Aliarcobacter skirrowii]RXJ80574.1 hypothetical protein CRU86_00585 [Aliarcobacter skirrowii]